LILLIDNYDSFVHNLARYFRRLGHDTRIVRNDAICPPDIQAAPPQAIVLSPGPCTPQQAGCSIDVVRHLCGEIPILGICLGHQAICQALGGRVIRAPEPMHGRASLINHDGQGVFAGIPNPLCVGRYHSLIADAAGLPGDLEISATTEDGIIMAVRHVARPIIGLQFHPESILTNYGYQLLAGFLNLAGLPTPQPWPAGIDEHGCTGAPRTAKAAAPSLAGVTF
jgi:anthranilate synthase/aminodeoxychorismate synthase-like glutamine amidotransferase